MKPGTILTVLSLTVGLGLLQSGCVTNGGGGLSPGMTAQLDTDATAVLQSLYASTPAAKSLGRKAKAILIFPDILKGGFMFGGQIGNGVLRQHGRTVGYYNTVAASYGFQAGLQSFGYVMFLMNDAAAANLHKPAAGKWESARASSSSIRAPPAPLPPPACSTMCTLSSSIRRGSWREPACKAQRSPRFSRSPRHTK